MQVRLQSCRFHRGSATLAAMPGTRSTRAGLEQVPGRSRRARWHSGQPGTGPGVWQGWRNGEMAFGNTQVMTQGLRAAGAGQPHGAAATA